MYLYHKKVVIPHIIDTWPHNHIITKTHEITGLMLHNTDKIIVAHKIDNNCKLDPIIDEYAPVIGPYWYILIDDVHSINISDTTI